MKVYDSREGGGNQSCNLAFHSFLRWNCCLERSLWPWSNKTKQGTCKGGEPGWWKKKKIYLHFLPQLHTLLKRETIWYTLQSTPLLWPQKFLYISITCIRVPQFYIKCVALQQVVKPYRYFWGKRKCVDCRIYWRAQSWRASISLLHQPGRVTNIP